MDDQLAVIQSKADFKSTPAGQQQRWQIEINAAKKEVKKWHDLGRRIVDRFLDKRKGNESNETRLNLFSANLQTQRSMLFGKIPKASVSRRFEDYSDNVARAAANMMERLLNTDIEEDTDTFADSIALALDDKLLVGMGNVRLRYEAEFDEQEEVPAVLDGEGNELAPAYTPEPKKSREEVQVDYVHWRDQYWSPARTWQEIRWYAFGVQMSYDQLVARFGKDKAKKVPLSNSGKRAMEVNENLRNDPLARGYVYEIWSKEDKKVYWFAEGMPELLDTKDDPLGLEGFFPCPRPMMSNLTTESFMPRPDWCLAQDLYTEIDYVSTRITLLERATKVVGVYDKTADGVRRMLTEGFDNDLIPVDNWALFAERGGIKGQIDWLPLDQVVGALDKLREYRAELIQLVYQVTGLSDIMRGEQVDRETATTSALKAKFASVRMQSNQDEFARFASDALRIKAEIIVKHFDDESILAESNVQATPDAQYALDAISLLRSDLAKYRVEIKPENISQTDLAQLKAERMEFAQALSMLLQSFAPLMQNEPATAPFLLEFLKWTVAGFRGASTIEGVIDQAADTLRQQLSQPKQDPKTQADMAKAQMDVQVAKQQAQIDIQHMQAKHQIDQQKLGLDAQKAQLDVAKMAAQMRMDAQRQAMELASPTEQASKQAANEAQG